MAVCQHENPRVFRRPLVVHAIRDRSNRPVDSRPNTAKGIAAKEETAREYCSIIHLGGLIIRICKQWKLSPHKFPTIGKNRDDKIPVIGRLIATSTCPQSPRCFESDAERRTTNPH
jgi:hypothetical protein